MAYFTLRHSSGVTEIIEASEAPVGFRFEQNGEHVVLNIDDASVRLTGLREPALETDDDGV